MKPESIKAIKDAYDIEQACIAELKDYIDEEQFGKAVELLAKKLEEFYTFPTLLQKAGENGLRIVKENFSEDNFVDNFKKIAEGIK